MKTLLLLFALAVPALHAQTPKVSMELGMATVWLGMDRADVKHAVEAVGMHFSDEGGTVIAVDTKANRIYELQFKDAKLITLHLPDNKVVIATTFYRYRTANTAKKF